MKRLYPFVLLALCVILTGCGKNRALEGAESFSEKLSSTENISFTASLRTEYDDKTVSFLLAFASDADGCTVTVIEPALIRGISAHIKDGETKLVYDTVALDTGELDAFGLSPMSSLPLLVDAMKNGFIESAWEENGEYCADIIASDELSVQLRLDKYTLTPTHAELISEGRVKVFVDIKDFQCEKTT